MEEFSRYKVIETYLGEEIVVNVSEYWTDEGIDGANISCSYNSIIRGLGHKVGNYKPGKYGGMQGEIVSRLKYDDIHNAIFKEFYIAEMSIAESKKEKHDNFKYTRHFHIIVEYEGQEISVGLMLKSGRSEARIICPSTYLVASVPMEDNMFRDRIISEVEKSKKLIDRGYVFPKPGIVSKVKKKIKNYINYGV